MRLREVYIVTIGRSGDVEGDYFKPECYENTDEALIAADECMRLNGGRENFVQVGLDGEKPHIVYQWSMPRHGKNIWVWLERLAVRTYFRHGAKP